jgi:hypothetical protein
MIWIDFSDEEEASIRAALGFRDGDREFTPDDLIVALTARQVVLGAERAWLDGESP